MIDVEIDIKSYIENSIPDLRDCLCPVFTTDIKGLSVVYMFTPVSGGHLKESQLELKIIHDDYDYCKEIEEQIKGLLDMEEDAPYVCTGKTRFRSQVAGGGCLFNDGVQMYEDTLYFILDWRKI